MDSAITLKVGDVVKVKGMGYAEKYISTYTITRVTAKYAFAKINDSEVKFSLSDFTRMPRDRYINYYIFEVNGQSVSNW